MQRMDAVTWPSGEVRVARPTAAGRTADNSSPGCGRHPGDHAGGQPIFRGVGPGPILKVRAPFGSSGSQDPDLGGRAAVSGTADTQVARPLSRYLPHAEIRHDGVPHESDVPGTTDGSGAPGEADPARRGRHDPRALEEVIRRLESGFYETAEVREQIARKVRKELDQ